MAREAVPKSQLLLLGDGKEGGKKIKVYGNSQRKVEKNNCVHKGKGGCTQQGSPGWVQVEPTKGLLWETDLHLQRAAGLSYQHSASCDCGGYTLFRSQRGLENKEKSTLSKAVGSREKSAN